MHFKPLRVILLLHICNKLRCVMGFYENYSCKIRINLSSLSKSVMDHDMAAFNVTKPANFINTVFSNYRDSALSSIELTTSNRRNELDRILPDSGDDNGYRTSAIDKLIEYERCTIIDKINSFKQLEPGSSVNNSKVYHINNVNMTFLTDDNSCSEDIFYGKDKASVYIKCVIEEYCRLPFIKREHIFKKDVYKAVNDCINENKMFTISQTIDGKTEKLYVYPYKILTDTLSTLSYLACYTKKENESDSKKVAASFNMARIGTPKILVKSSFEFTSKEIEFLENKISLVGVEYLLNKAPKENTFIRVKLTNNGIRKFHDSIDSRPHKIETESSDNIYAFRCSYDQIINYFFPFGRDAIILEPEDLKERFKRKYSNALKNYQ